MLTRAFNELAFSKSKGFQEYVYTRKGFKYWRIQNPRGFKGYIYTFNELASPKLKGFQGKYIHVRASNIGVSKVQRVSRETYILSMNWRLQNPKGFRENIYTNMTSIKISSSVHSETTLSP